MSFGPKAGRRGQWINLLLFPPATLIALPVKFTVVQSANGNGEPVADFSSHRALLSEPDVVGIGRRAAADQARLSGHKSQMVAIAFRYRLADDSDLLRAALGPPRLAAMAIRFLILRLRYCRFLAELSEPRSKNSFDRLCIFSGELVFEWQRAVRPRSEGFRVCELLKLRDQALPKPFGGALRQTCWRLPSGT